MAWQLQEAKARLSELLRASQKKGPQEITVHGRTAAVLVAKEDYDRLVTAKPGFLELLRNSPLAGTNLRLTRDRTPARKVRL